MELHTGSLLWPAAFPDCPAYTPLDNDTTCEVLVVGSGVSGALTAYRLAETGVDVALADKRTIGSGSTAANTGLLQVANDKTLTACIDTFGKEKGVRFYPLCLSALNRLETIASQLDIDSLFRRRNSLYFASRPDDVPALMREYGNLLEHGFPVEYWDADAIRRHFPFRKSAAVYWRGDAEVDPYRLAHALLASAADRGLRVYPWTEIVARTVKKDRIVFRTKGGHMITAQYAVIAAGYETQEMKRNGNAELTSTYALATQPLPDLSDWHDRCLIWETARPYLYLRTTPDNRIVTGGLDESANDPHQRKASRRAKSRVLLEAVRQLFPDLPELRAEYAWSAAFGSTRDGMPLIGEQDGFPRCLFALGYGGNGTVYSAVAADIVTGLIVDGKHPDAGLFRFKRQPVAL